MTIGGIRDREVQIVRVMGRGLAERWWSFVARGLLAIAFGVLTWVFPGISLLSLVYLFGAYALAEGALAFAAALRRSADDERPWWMLALQGVAGTLAGLGTLLVPRVTAFVLLAIIAGWAIVTGVLQIVAAMRLRKEIRGEWLLALGGALSVAFGVLVMLFPRTGALAIVLWIGAYAITLGALFVVLGFRLHGRLRHATERREAAGARGTFASSAP